MTTVKYRKQQILHTTNKKHLDSVDNTDILVELDTYGHK